MRKTGREGEARSDSFLSSFEEVLDQNDAASTSTSEIWRSRRGLDPPPITVDMETRNVYCAKLVMIGVLSIAAVAVAMTTFLITSGQVETEFQQRVSVEFFFNFMFFVLPSYFSYVAHIKEFSHFCISFSSQKSHQKL